MLFLQESTLWQKIPLLLVTQHLRPRFFGRESTVASRGIVFGTILTGCVNMCWATRRSHPREPWLWGLSQIPDSQASGPHCGMRTENFLYMPTLCAMPAEQPYIGCHRCWGQRISCISPIAFRTDCSMFRAFRHDAWNCEWLG